MAEEIIRKCDYPVGRGRNVHPHGELIGEPTRFRVDTKEYVADICDEHKAEMLEALKPFMQIARKAGSALPRNARGRAVMRAKGGVTFTSKDVRQWLIDEGRDVGQSGRIPNAQIEEYKAAHGLL